jgi:hypothetical protein
MHMAANKPHNMCPNSSTWKKAETTEIYFQQGIYSRLIPKTHSTIHLRVFYLLVPYLKALRLGYEKVLPYG